MVQQIHLTIAELNNSWAIKATLDWSPILPYLIQWPFPPSICISPFSPFHTIKVTSEWYLNPKNPKRVGPFDRKHAIGIACQLRNLRSQGAWLCSIFRQVAAMQLPSPRLPSCAIDFLYCFSMWDVRGHEFINWRRLLNNNSPEHDNRKVDQSYTGEKNIGVTINLSMQKEIISLSRHNFFIYFLSAKQVS